MKSHGRRRSLGWMSLLAVLAILVAAAGCSPPLDEISKYPAPPPTEKLATLLAKGIATALPAYPGPEYPVPIPGPLRGPNPTPTLAAISSPAPVQAAKFYLAGRLDEPPSDIMLVSWEDSVWSVASLGCTSVITSTNPVPQSSLINGYRIFYQANGTQYELRSDLIGDTICLAEALLPGERIPVDGSGTTQEFADTARIHLSSRLGISPDSVRVEGIQAGEWMGDNLGCGAPVSETSPPQTQPASRGSRIVLSANNSLFEYRSGGTWLIFCGNPSS